MVELVIAVLVVIIGSAICSGTEAALFSVSAVRVRQLAQKGGPSARALLTIKSNMARPIAAVVILNNVANIVGSITVGSIASQLLGSYWLGIFSAMLTLLIIVFSEIIPKTLGEQHSESISLAVARPLLAVSLVMGPIVRFIELVTKPFTRGKPRPATNEAEIRLLARIGKAEGTIEEDESEMIQRVFALNDQTAADIMTPRVKITALSASQSLGEAQEAILASTHSRIVLYGENIDSIVGVALKAELLKGLIEGGASQPVSEFSRPVRLVPESVRADRLLEQFRRARQHLFVVINEYGGVSGVVTLEDVLEVITGEIVDETDTVVDLQEDARRGAQRLLEGSTAASLVAAAVARQSD